MEEMTLPADGVVSTKGEGYDDPSNCRRDRKEKGKQLKRQRIEQAGGVRPRDNSQPHKKDERASNKKKKSSNNNNNKPKNQQREKIQESKSQSRFGKVMDSVPCRNRPRFSTLSIALPGSVLSNCQTRELKTVLVGQIARACTIYHVDEVVVFDDKLSRQKKLHSHNNYNTDRSNLYHRDDGRRGRHNSNNTKDDDDNSRLDYSCSFLARVLQYCECPQYLRRNFFPRHPDLQFAGMLPPIDAPHHVRMEDRARYREGVVIEEKGKEGGVSSLVNCGVQNRPIEIDRLLPVGIRCTVQIDLKEYGRPGKHMSGKVMSPAAPREDNGTYWGYQTRIADSLQKVFTECPFESGYDLKIGTSERGDVNIDDGTFFLPLFRHCLIVFGGVAGIEECVDADETHRLPGSQSRQLFDLWVNVCKYQGSRTIRTEEAVLISLAKFSPLLAANEEVSQEKHPAVGESPETKEISVEFSDAVSEESNDSDSIGV